MAEVLKDEFSPNTDVPLTQWDNIYINQKAGWSVPIINTIVKKVVFDEFIDGGKSLDFFLPLCGKSPDMLWLANQGHRVTGAEWSKCAVEYFFTENKVDYEVLDNVDVGKGKGAAYKAKYLPITIYCCDFFDLIGEKIGQFDRIWDNGSVGSFPIPHRADYAKTIHTLISPHGRMLLSSFHYDHDLHPMLPLSVSPDVVQEMFGANFDVSLVQKEGGDVFRSCYPTIEEIDPRKFPYFEWIFCLITPKKD